MPSVCGVAISLYKFCASCGPSEPASINFHFPDFFLRVGGIREGEEAKAICRLVMVCPVNGEGMGIGIWGWSYGGYMTLMSMSEGTPVFKAGVAVAAPTDWRFYDTIYTERFMRTPKENAEGYKESSAL